MANDPHAETRDSTTDQKPSNWTNLFASQFTPTTAFGLLLATCVLLPSYDGCNNTTVYGYSAVADATTKNLTLPDYYLIFLSVWPFLFGGLVTFGTSLAVVRRRIEPLWWALAVLVVAHALLLLALMIVGHAEIRESFTNGKAEGEWVGITFVGVALLTLLVLLLARRYCRTKFAAAMWLQAMLSLLAATSVTFVIPMIYLAGGPLIGAKLAHGSCLGLLMISIVHWFDGQRALNRNRGESPLQLSMKATLVLMLVGGLLFAWGVTYAVVELAPAE